MQREGRFGSGLSRVTKITAEAGTGAQTGAVLLRPDHDDGVPASSAEWLRISASAGHSARLQSCPLCLREYSGLLTSCPDVRARCPDAPAGSAAAGFQAAA